MQARRRTSPSTDKTPHIPGRSISSRRSRPEIRGSEPAERVMSPSNGSNAVEELARAAEALLVERIGAETVDRAKKLFDQQLWLWGQDIARLSRNGLIGFGFERHAPPVGLQTSSCYTLADASHRHVGLWGFGTFYGEAEVGGLFLKRYYFGPCVTAISGRPPHCWAFDQWPTHRPPTTPDDWLLARRLLDGFLGWIAEYEQWIAGHTPRWHRTECLRDWKKRCCGPRQLVTEWESLRKSLSERKQDDSRESAAA